MKTNSFATHTLNYLTFERTAAVLVALAWSAVAFGEEIHDAAEEGNLNRVKALLQADPSLANLRDTDPRPQVNGNTPLHMAVAYNKRTDVAEYLLANKADVNATNNNSQTPLHIAALWGLQPMEQLLLNHGADVNTRDKNGETPLLSAARNGKLNAVKLMLANKAEITVKDNNGNTPLHAAAQFFHTDIAQFLLTKGVDVNARNNKGETPLYQTAFSRGHTDIIKLLLANRADVNAKTTNGATPLHLAAVNGSTDTAEVLLANGAEVNAKDNKGRTPLQLIADKTVVPNPDKRVKAVADLLGQHGGQ